MPVAVNCWLAPMAIEEFDGVTVIETKVGVITVSSVEPLTAPQVAVMVDDPPATPAPNPEADIIAMLPAVEPQVAAAVRSFVLPSL